MSLGGSNGPVTCCHGPENDLPLIFTGYRLATAAVRAARSRDARQRIEREEGAGVWIARDAGGCLRCLLVCSFAVSISVLGRDDG